MHKYEIAYLTENDTQGMVLHSIISENFRSALEDWLEIMYFTYIDKIKERWYYDYNSFKSRSETNFILKLLLKEGLWIFDIYADIREDWDFSQLRDEVMEEIENE